MVLSGVLLIMIVLTPSDGLDGLPLLEKGVKRVSSYDLTGGDHDYLSLEPGGALVLADIQKPGTIKRFYIKVDSEDPAHLRTMLLRFYWDGSKSPCVESPLGDFFGLGHSRYYEVNSLPLVTGNNRGMTCFFPMPFKKSALMVLENEGRGRTSSVYFQIDYIPGMPEEGSGLFHAQYTQGFLTRSSGDHLALKAKGKGRFAGMVLSIVLGEDGWFWSGDEKFYIDGEKLPSIRGTGLDDYFGGAFGFKPKFCSPFFGTPLAGNALRGAEFTGYRFHIEDPIIFRKELAVFLEHQGQRYVKGRKVYDRAARRDEYYCVAYWYQEPRHQPFALMPYVGDRITGDRSYTIEGEMLEILGSSGDPVSIKVLDGAAILLFEADGKTHDKGETGDFISFRLVIPRAGMYEISGRFLRSRQCGCYQLSVNGESLGEPIDFYNDRGGKGRNCEILEEKVVLGRINIPGSEQNIFKFKACRNGSHSESCYFGIDSLMIRPIE